MIEVFVAIGSNLNHPQQQVLTATTHLANIQKTELLQASSLYQTTPLGPQDQPDFINRVVHLKTLLPAQELLQELWQIEQLQGRDRGPNSRRWGPRPLDLDMLLYGQEQITTEWLTIPHLGLKTREFVLYPLAEIAPNWVLPSGERVDELAQQCPIRGLIKLENQSKISHQTLNLGLSSRKCDAQAKHATNTLLTKNGVILPIDDLP